MGLFEAKTKLSELCQWMAETGRGLTITRRGESLVRLEPVHAERPRSKSLWAKRARHLQIHSPLPADEKDFESPESVPTHWRDPLT